MQEQYRCTIVDEYVVRVAGLPLTTLRGLRFHNSLALIQQLLQLEERLNRDGIRLAEQLHAVIGSLAGDELRRPRQLLINLRRAIFQGSQPSPALLDPSLLAYLPAELRTAIVSWQGQLQQRASLLEEARRVFAAELDERRAVLRDLVSRERFLQGLLLASPSLYLDCCRWLTAAPAEARQYLDRKLEDGLLNYLTRMAAKTSPYSTFTALARGRFAPEQEQPPPPFVASPEQGELEQGHSVIELNRLLIHHIARALAQWPSIRPYLRVSLNPSLVISGPILRFISRDDLGHENLAKMRATPALQAMLQLIERHQALTYRELLQALSAQIPPERQQAVASWLEQLITCGLLQLDFAIPELAQDYLRRLSEALASIDQARVQTLRALLLELDQTLVSYERTSQAHQRYDMLLRLRTLLERLLAELGLNERAGFTLPAKNLLYEHTLLKTAPGNYLPALEADLVADLALVQRLMGLYDPLLAGRIALATFFSQRYGAGARVDLLTFYEDYWRASHQLGSAVSNQWAERTSLPASALSTAQALQAFTTFFTSGAFEQQKLTSIMTLRQVVAHSFVDQPSDNGGICYLDRQRLWALLEQCPAPVKPLRSLAIYCQLYWENGQRCLVLNSIQSGFGRSLRRLGYLELEARLAFSFQESESDQLIIPDSLPDTAEQPLPIAIQGVFGSNLNLRLPASEYEIAYPGCSGSDRSERTLPFSDLLVEYDPASQQLQLLSRRLKRKLLPIHLGLMSDYWLPPLYRFLLWVFGDAPIDYLWILRMFLHGQSSRYDDQGEREERPRYQPRICLGRLCLDRARWYLPQSCLPVRHKGESHFDYFLKVQRWRVQYRLPARCFLRLQLFDFQQHEELSRLAYPLGKERKPVYIDFESYFSLSMLEHLIAKSSSGLLLEEALPTEADLLPTHEGGSVCEYVFEVNSEGV